MCALHELSPEELLLPRFGVSSSVCSTQPLPELASVTRPINQLPPSAATTRHLHTSLITPLTQGRSSLLPSSSLRHPRPGLCCFMSGQPQHSRHLLLPAAPRAQQPRWLPPNSRALSPETRGFEQKSGQGMSEPGLSPQSISSPAWVLTPVPGAAWDSARCPCACWVINLESLAISVAQG